MEKYFKEHDRELKAMEIEPQTTETEFLRLYGSRMGGRRILRLTTVTVAVAAAIVCGVVLFGTSGLGIGRKDLVSRYVKEFTAGVMPLYVDMKAMEEGSELCREVGLSAEMEAILRSIPQFCDELNGLPGRSKWEETRQYCESQREKIIYLYAQCTSIYSY